MDALFGDATTAMPTPAQQAEVDSLMNARSPVPSLDIRRPGTFTADSAIPGLDIDPPAEPPADFPGGKSRSGSETIQKGEGYRSWISNIQQRMRGDGRGRPTGDGSYARLRNEDE